MILIFRRKNERLVQTTVAHLPFVLLVQLQLVSTPDAFSATHAKTLSGFAQCNDSYESLKGASADSNNRCHRLSSQKDLMSTHR